MIFFTSLHFIKHLVEYLSNKAKSQLKNEFLKLMEQSYIRSPN